MQSEQKKNSEANLSSQKVEGSWERADKLNMMSTSPTEVLNSTLLSLQIIKGNYLTIGRLLIHKIMYTVSVHICHST